MSNEENCNELLIKVDINHVHPNLNQPRTFFANNELLELAQSIASVGLIHPPLVRSLPGGGGYQLISGERRWRAARLAGLTVIPVVVSVSDDRHTAQAALIENVQRVDLSPLEIARALQSLAAEYRYNQEQLAAIIGKKRSTVANYLRLLSLSPEIQESLETGKITMGHAKALLALDDEPMRLWLLRKIVREDLSVRQAEELSASPVKRLQRKKEVSGENDLFLHHITEELQRQLGTKVSIQCDGSRGKIAIDFYSLDDFERLTAILSGGAGLQT